MYSMKSLIKRPRVIPPRPYFLRITSSGSHSAPMLQIKPHRPLPRYLPGDFLHQMLLLGSVNNPGNYNAAVFQEIPFRVGARTFGCVASRALSRCARARSARCALASGVARLSLTASSSTNNSTTWS